MRALLPLLICLSCFGVELTNLPVIRLETKEAIKSDARVGCTALLKMPTGYDGSDPSALQGQIKFRGASSQAYDKKSFALKLEKSKGWLGMPPNREWVLNAAFVDASMMRHKLSYDLFRAMGSETAPRFAASSRFVEVELNGRYHGVYLLMQPVDDLLVGLSPADKSDVTPAVIYKAVDHAANFAQPGHDGFEQRQPNPAIKESWGPLDDLYRFVSQAPDKEFFDPTLGIASRMDIDNAIDFHLLVLMTSNLDGITKNYNLVRRAVTATNPNPKFYFVPWDYDATFGRNWDGSMVDAKSWLSNRLFDRLLGNALYKTKYAQRWKALRSSLFTAENLSRMMDENVAALGPAALRNEKRWKNLNYANPQELTSTYDVVQMKRWVPLRLKWLDTELARLTSK
ncbi:MAG: CotH kinase family protein [Verrucomicrobiota bacterium]